MTRRTVKRVLLGMAAGLLTGTTSAVTLDSSSSGGVAYGVLVCGAVGNQLQVQLFDFSGSASGVSAGQPCVPFIAQLKSSGFQVGAPEIGLVVPNNTDSLVWEVQGTQ
jgi:hypothetical protein